VAEAGDPWAVLGIERTATPEEARRAYLLRSQLLHPDRHQGSSPELLAEAERAMRALNEAWAHVRDELAEGAPGSPGETRAPPAGPSDQQEAPPRPPPGPGPGGVDEWIDWVMARLAVAARSDGDPLQPVEIARLRSPLAAVPSGRRYERWLRHRTTTLEHAIRADGPGGRSTWAAATRILDDAGTAIVLTRLLHRPAHPGGR